MGEMDRTGGLNVGMRWLLPAKSTPAPQQSRIGGGTSSCSRCKIQTAVLDAYQDAVKGELIRAVDLAIGGQQKGAIEIARRYADERIAQRLLEVLTSADADQTELSALKTALSG
jgi:hypothetical protein